jgi:RimJ/RimL family protein N-acetyltransferase
MHVERFADPAHFRSVVESLLLRDEPRHNLMLGLLGTLIEQPDVYPSFHLWVAREGDTVMGAGLRTPPHLLVLAAPRTDDVLPALSAAIVEEGMDLPGVLGGLPEAEAFAALHTEATGKAVSSRMEQGIYALEDLIDPPVPPGTSRVAGPTDLDLLLAWSRAFNEDGGGALAWDDDEARRRLAHRLGTHGAWGYRIWEDGEPVSLVGYGSPTPTGIRIGPVYTPPERRRRGYATALTARVSRDLLAGGRRFCFLYTDMANPTSNAIYRRIGYRLVCGSAMIRFGDRTRV